MPSSRYLIHPDAGGPGGGAGAGADQASHLQPGPANAPSAHSAAPAGSSVSVLRGRGRSSGGVHVAPPAPPLPGALGESGVDPAAIAAEIERLEADAERRGYEAGRSRAEAELRTAILAAGALAARLDQVAPERTSEIAHTIAELSISVARRILQHEVHIDPTVLCTSMEAAIATINGSPEAHVLLNPASVDAVRAAWEAQHGRAYLGKRWVFEGDPNLPLGGCTVRYDHGFVEAGLESQLEEIGIALDRAIPSLARSATDEDVA